MADTATAPVEQRPAVDIVRLVLAGLAVAVFALAAFHYKAWLIPVLSLMWALESLTGLSRIAALTSVTALASGSALVIAAGMVSTTLSKQHPAELLAQYLGHGVAFSLAMSSAALLLGLDGVERWTVLLALAPVAPGLLAAAAAAVFFTGIHEFEDDIVPYEDDFTEGEEPSHQG